MQKDTQTPIMIIILQLTNIVEFMGMRPYLEKSFLIWMSW